MSEIASGWLELVYDYIDEPERAAAALRRNPSAAAGFLGFALGATGLFASRALSGIGLPPSAPLLALSILLEITAGYGLAAVLHLFISMSGHEGSATGLFAAFGLADMAWCLAAPAALILRLIRPGSSALFAAAMLVVGFLGLALKVRGVKDVYGVDSQKAWFYVLLPYLAAAALLLLAVGLVIWIMVLGAFNSGLIQSLANSY